MRMISILRTAMELTKINEKAAQLGCPEDAELHVVLVDAQAVRELNRTYLGRNGDTDVIAFPLFDADEPLPGPPVFGEIYVCLDVARRAARRCETSVAYETVLYAVHGMLHLCGLDDRTPAQKRSMAEHERKILAEIREKIGIDGIFDLS